MMNAIKGCGLGASLDRCTYHPASAAAANHRIQRRTIGTLAGRKAGTSPKTRGMKTEAATNRASDMRV